MAFRLTVDIEGAAFADNPAPEVARILRAVAEDLERGGDYDFFRTLRDVNGNDVGRARMRREEDER